MIRREFAVIRAKDIRSCADMICLANIAEGPPERMQAEKETTP